MKIMVELASGGPLRLLLFKLKGILMLENVGKIITDTTVKPDDKFDKKLEVESDQALSDIRWEIRDKLDALELSPEDKGQLNAAFEREVTQLDENNLRGGLTEFAAEIYPELATPENFKDWAESSLDSISQGHGLEAAKEIEKVMEKITEKGDSVSSINFRWLKNKLIKQGGLEFLSSENIVTLIDSYDTKKAKFIAQHVAINRPDAFPEKYQYMLNE